MSALPDIRRDIEILRLRRVKRSYLFISREVGASTDTVHNVIHNGSRHEDRTSVLGVDELSLKQRAAALELMLDEAERAPEWRPSIPSVTRIVMTFGVRSGVTGYVPVSVARVSILDGAAA